mmetsp:Transcript_21846/g.61871  ORF Transcript_21846/g.61871 Transcript_21846/m.61871 type:complete len:347 (-) Transcript_21846:236-1276(-)
MVGPTSDHDIAAGRHRNATGRRPRGPQPAHDLARGQAIHHSAEVVERGQAVASGKRPKSEVHVHWISRVIAEVAQELAGHRVPQTDNAVVLVDRQGRAATDEGEVKHPTLKGERELLAARGGIPDDGPWEEIGGGHRAATWRDPRHADGEDVPGQPASALARGQVPSAGRALAPVHQQSAPGREYLDVPRPPALKHCQRLAGLGIPDHDPAAHGARHDPAATREDLRVRDIVGAAHRHPPLPRENVPNDHFAVPVPSQQSAAGWEERHAGDLGGRQAGKNAVAAIWPVDGGRLGRVHGRDLAEDGQQVQRVRRNVFGEAWPCRAQLAATSLAIQTVTCATASGMRP